MVDGGHQYAYGPLDQWVDYYYAYKALVDVALSRAPEAEMNASVSREGNQLIVEVTVKNLKNVTLAYASNKAAVTVIVYEDSSEGLTSRIERAVKQYNIPSLEYNATATYPITLTSTDLTRVDDWDKLHTVAVVEYQPSGSDGPYDMLQAVLATPVPLKVRPESKVYLIDASNKKDQTLPVNVTGFPSTLVWTATSNQPAWLSVSPTTGTVGTSAAIKVDADVLFQGLYNGVVTFSVTVSGLQVTKEVDVHANVTEVIPLYLPVVQRW